MNYTKLVEQKLRAHLDQWHTVVRRRIYTGENGTRYIDIEVISVTENKRQMITLQAGDSANFTYTALDEEVTFDET